jgi:crotonobetainyl-CoA:carnitine CoA-transferase CaiB-like acyl-CoA transferase
VLEHLAEVLAALGGEPELPAPVRLTGDLQPGLLASVFPVIELATAAVGASLVAAARLESVRTGRPAADVELDAAHAACAVRSERYVRANGQPASGGFAPLSQFFPTADGWIRLHANYPWHRERLLGVLGTTAEPDAVAAAVAGWRGVELEDAILSAGGCAAVVRRPEEWLAHPQGRSVSRLPLLELLPSGGAAHELPLAGPLPASGLRVLDLTRVIAGPVCTRTLAAHGAEVLRVDSPWLPENEGHTLDSLAGKRSALLDLERTEDRQRLDDLVASADVVVQGYRPGALARYGLAPQELLARRPGLVVLTLSAWGHVGPWAGRRGFDSLVQPATGIAHSEAAGGGAPGVLPAQLLDHATGYLAAAAVLTGLARRSTDGTGWQARVSLAQTAAWVLRQPMRSKPSSIELDPSPYMLELDGPAGAATLVNPPGRLGGRLLAWPRPPARYGADVAEWLAPVPA